MYYRYIYEPHADHLPPLPGWLSDKFGLSWQVVPNVLLEMILDKDKAKVGYGLVRYCSLLNMYADTVLSFRRVTNTMMQMKKIDIAALKEAFEKDS